MTESLQQLVQRFHERFRAPVAERPTHIPKERAQLRVRLIAEELEEYARAAGLSVSIMVLEDPRTDRPGPDLVGVADALGDLAYVVLGSGVEHGITLDPVVREIHRSNMTKEGGGADEGGKILKGPGYEPPALEGILADQQAGKPPPQEIQDAVGQAFDELIEILQRPDLSRDEFEKATTDVLNRGFYDVKRAGWEQGLGEVLRIVNQGVGAGLKRGLPVRACMLQATNLLAALEQIQKKGPFRWFVTEGDAPAGGAPA